MKRKSIWIMGILLLLSLFLISCQFTAPGSTDVREGFDLFDSQVTAVDKISLTDGKATYRFTFSDGTSRTLTVGDTVSSAGSALSVTSVEKTGTEGETDTYTITFSDGTTQSFTVTNAKPLTVLSCKKTKSVGKVDTYTISFSDGTTAEFTVTNGADGKNGTDGRDGVNGTNGADGKDGAAAEPLTVVSCGKTRSEGKTDIYTLEFSDGTSTEFTVTNGTDGGSADTEPRLAELEKLMGEVLTGLRVQKKPAGTRTVTDPSLTSVAALRERFSGGGTWMNRDTMFGDRDTVYSITLNGWNIGRTDGQEPGNVTVNVAFQSLDLSDPNNITFVRYNDLIYTTEIVPCGVSDYTLDVRIPKADLDAAGLPEDFILCVYVTTTGCWVTPSANETCLMKEKNESLTTLGTNNGTIYLYSPYFVDNKASAQRNYGKYTPDMSFRTSEGDEYIFDFSWISSGDSGSTEGKETNVKLQLPDLYDLVVGDNFELFYKGILNCLDSDVYDFELNFADGKSRGTSYARKYVWTPAAADIGQHTLGITVRDQNGEAVDQGSVVLNVVAKPTSPAEEKVILCVGDSLTAGGVWPAELYRRLCESGGTPAGYGLTNIRFIGTCLTGSSTTCAGVPYEGYGGWTFSSYNTNYLRGEHRYIYAASAENYAALDAEADQHARYTDANGAVWKLESIEENRIKIIAVSGAYSSFPASGKLTYKDGGTGNVAEITYASQEIVGQNPFWDESAKKVDIKKYVEAQGAEKVDEVIVLLGWNNTGIGENPYKQQVRIFLDNFHTAYPDCKVTLVGLQVPLHDGFGSSYGTAWNYYEKLQYVWKFQQWYIDITHEEAYSGFVSYVSIAGQFDSVNNMPMKQIPVNNRNPNTETVCSNGVHPAQAGYLQIADAILRHMAAKFQ